MTLGALIGSGIAIGVSVASAGTAAPIGVAAGVAAAETIAATATAAGLAGAGAAGAAATGAAAAGAAATGAGVAGVAAGAATAGSLTSGAAAGAAAGALGGPIGVFIFCFEENTKVTMRGENGRIESVTMDKLKVGDFILTSEDDITTFTEVTNATKLTAMGNVEAFSAKKLTFSDGSGLTVTDPHQMIVNTEDGNFVKSAKDLAIGDIMLKASGERIKIADLKSVDLKTKVNVETKKGTLYANGILTTGMCEHGHQEIVRKISDVLMEYNSTHGFGALTECAA